MNPPPATTCPGTPELGTPEIGSVINGRYRLESVLGSGLSSTVFCARVVGEGTHSVGNGLADPPQVALKLLHASLTTEEQLARRFRREARILSSLSGPHVAKVLDFGETEWGQPFMVMELAHGQSLAQEIADAPIPPNRTVTLAIQMCEALSIAHSAGVVHRDLKPQNVVIENSGTAQERARVLDFGMAKILRGELQESVNALTQQNMIFGTPEYMAPEQARGDEVDERADLYAMGVLLYEMLTGTVPFRANSPIGVMTAHLVDNPVPPSQLPRGITIPPALEAVVMHALAKRPEDRYSTAQGLAAALQSALQHPDDVNSTAPPRLDSAPVPEGPNGLPSVPNSPPDLATRDTDLELHMTAALRKTEVSLDNSRPSNSMQAEPVSRIWLIVAIVAALSGVLMGIIMSLVGALR